MDVKLILVKKNNSRKSFSLSNGVTVIGRRHDCDLRIPLMSVSRKHCQLNRDEGVLKIRDLGSRNGTYLNGKRIDESVIKAGDYIEVGPLKFLLQINGEPKDIAEPEPEMAAQVLPQEGVSKGDSAADDFESFIELDELDSLEDDSDSLLDELDSLDEIGS
jgi:pSer/pThr/pTyr-binding forkhead associated (FHA) protein